MGEVINPTTRGKKLKKNCIKKYLKKRSSINLIFLNQQIDSGTSIDNYRMDRISLNHKLMILLVIKENINQ